MNIVILTFSAIFYFGSSTVLAKESANEGVPSSEFKSELYFQPLRGENSLKVGLGGTKTNPFEYTSNGSKLMSGEGNSSSMLLDYLFGFTEQSAIGFRAGYGTSDSSSTSVSGNVTQSKYAGMNDFYFKYASYSKMNSLKVNYGMSCGLSPEKARSSSSTRNGNNFSGGTSFIPFVAIEMGEGSLHYGLGLASTLRMTRQLEQASSNPGTSETTGGNSVSLTPYFEVQMGSGLFGGQIILGSLDKSKTTTSTGTTSESNSLESKSALITYAHDFSSSFRLVGEFAYVTWVIPASGIVDSANISFMSYGLSGRFGF